MLRAVLLALCLLLFGTAHASQQHPEAVRPVEPPEVAAARGFDRVGSAEAQLVRVSGANADCDATEEGVWTAGGAFNFLAAADELRIKSGGNAADIYGGNGAQEIVVVGLDANWDVISEVIQTKGAAASDKTAQKFIRLNDAYVRISGTNGAANTGAIDIETEAGTTIAQIPAVFGKKSGAFYTVPDGYTGYVPTWAPSSTVAGFVSLSTHIADDVATPFASRNTQIIDGVLNGRLIKLGAPLVVPARTDVFATCSVGTNMIVSAYFDIYLVPDTTPIAATPTPMPSPSPTPTPTPTP